jgi:glycosyltransferase involved in cell wall biosynthesis
MAYGGVETAVLNWLERIDRSSFDPHLVCFENPGGTESHFVRAAETRGFSVDKVPWGRRKPMWKAARRLAQILHERDIRILHTHNWYADFVGALAALMVPVKTVTTLYVWSDFDWKRNFLQWLDQHVIRRFDVISAHCEDTRRKTVALGIPEERVRTLICGFDAPRVELSAAERELRRSQFGIKPGEIVLGNIARLYPEKAQESLLRIFRQIIEDEPKTRLWIVGIGPLEERLKSLTAELGLRERVSFLGFIDDLPNFLPLVDIQVNSSTAEGVPLAICSGLAAGLPIVATAVGGLPEILDYGRHGILVDPGDERGFVDAVLHLIHNSEERIRLGKLGQQFISNEYSLDVAVARLHKTYREVLRSCRSASS